VELGAALRHDRVGRCRKEGKKGRERVVEKAAGTSASLYLAKGRERPLVRADKTSRSSAETYPHLLLSSLHNIKSRTRTTTNGDTHLQTTVHNSSRRVRPASSLEFLNGA
jgi:hypothetical protein